MKVFVDAAEAAERLEELIDLAVRQDDVVVCRRDQPVAVLTGLFDHEKQHRAKKEQISGHRS